MGWREGGAGTGCGSSCQEGRDAPLRRVMGRRQRVVSMNGLRPDAAEGGYLPAVGPYGVLRMMWAIWREVPGVEPKEALSPARRIRREDGAAVLATMRFLAGHVGGMLLARHRPVAGPGWVG